MIEIVYEYIVKEQYRRQFELAFGPGGLWSSLYAQCFGFRGTTVLRDTINNQRYLVIDLWDTVELHDQACADKQNAYTAQQSTFQEWTDKMSEFGSFRILAEATVRSRSKSSHHISGTSRRSKRQ